MLSTKPLPLKSADFKTRKTAAGLWREYKFEDGRYFREYTSNATIAGRPVISIANGIDPNTGEMATSDGIIAIGQRASGVIAIGQFVNGYLSIGQFATGRIAAIGQFAIAPVAIGQFTIAIASISQMGIAGFGIFQTGITYLGGIGAHIVNLSQYIHG